MIFGGLGGLNLPEICLTGEEKIRKKNSLRNLVLTGDRTRARCVTGAPATDCPIAVDICHGQGPSNVATREIARNLKTEENCEARVFKSN